MTIPAHGEHYGERRRPALARLYLAHERLAIGAGTLVGLLLAWEAFGRSGLVDPLFLPAPSQIAQAGWG
jgi:ABC-type nitrate/sulfonate/bicarbonate transport system permease component